jgi:hypothetical protein
MKKLLFVLMLSGCSSFEGVNDEGFPIVDGYQISAVALPEELGGPIYFGGSENSEMVRNHEQCHMRQIKEMGSGTFFDRYFSDKEFACRSERECGWPKNMSHPRCQGVDESSWNIEAQD